MCLLSIHDVCLKRLHICWNHSGFRAYGYIVSYTATVRSSRSRRHLQHVVQLRKHSITLSKVKFSLRKLLQNFKNKFHSSRKKNWKTEGFSLGYANLLINDDHSQSRLDTSISFRKSLIGRAVVWKSWLKLP